MNIRQFNANFEEFEKIAYSIKKGGKTFVRMCRSAIETEQGWLEEYATLPFIQFPADWKIKITPPCDDAVVRFRGLLPSGTEKSIYMDSRESLGSYDLQGTPYWEVYPVRNDIARCDKNDIKTLLELIADETIPEDNESSDQSNPDAEE